MKNSLAHMAAHHPALRVESRNSRCVEACSKNSGHTDAVWRKKIPSENHLRPRAARDGFTDSSGRGGHQIHIAFGFRVNLYHSFRNDTNDESGFGKGIRHIIDTLDRFNARGIADIPYFWTEIERSRRIRAAALNFLPFISDPAARSPIEQQVAAADIQRLRALSTTNYGMATPFLAPQRQRVMAWIMADLSHASDQIAQACTAMLHRHLEKQTPPLLNEAYLTWNAPPCRER